MEADSNTLRISSHSQAGEADCPLSGTALNAPYVRIGAQICRYEGKEIRIFTD